VKSARRQSIIPRRKTLGKARQSLASSGWRGAAFRWTLVPRGDARLPFCQTHATLRETDVAIHQTGVAAGKTEAAFSQTERPFHQTEAQFQRFSSAFLIFHHLPGKFLHFSAKNIRGGRITKGGENYGKRPDPVS
jgi:hypothetical protein